MSDVYTEQVTRLATVFDAVPVSSAKVIELVRALRGIPAEHLPLVVDQVIDTRMSGFLPTPGEIKAAYVELVLGPPAPDQALEWCLSTGKRQESDAFTDYYATPIFERPAVFRWVPKAPSVYPEPVTKEAVRLFGWQELIEADPEYRPAQWRKVYGQARELVSKRVQSGAVELRAQEDPVSMIERKATA